MNEVRKERHGAGFVTRGQPSPSIRRLGCPFVPYPVLTSFATTVGRRGDRRDPPNEGKHGGREAGMMWEARHFTSLSLHFGRVSRRSPTSSASVVSLLPFTLSTRVLRAPLVPSYAFTFGRLRPRVERVNVESERHE